MKKLLANSFLRELISIIIICIAIYFSSRAVFHDGFFRTIDDISTVRIEHMARELKREEWLSNFPVRYGAELSHKYGYFVYLFYSPLVYYVGAVAMILGGLSDIMATKLVYVIPLLIGPLLFYWAMRQKFDRLPAIVSTILYTLFPFRGFDTYIRGGVGEAWAMAFFPAIIGSFFFFERKNKWATIILSLFLALSIVSHNISGLLIFGVTCIYGLFFQLKNKKFWLSILLSLGLSAFFWLPSLAYTNIVKVSESVDHNGLVTNYLLPIKQLITPSLTYNIHDKATPFLVYILLFAGIVNIYLLKSKNIYKKHLLFWTITGIFLYVLLSQETKALWTFALPLSRNLQFPWRLFIVLSTIIPLVLALTLQVIKNKFFVVMMGMIVVYMSSIYLITFKPEKYSYYYNYIAEETGPCSTSWGEEYLPKTVTKCLTGPAVSSLKLSGDIKPTLLDDSLIDTRMKITTSKGGYVEAERYYFPGWHISIDNIDRELEYKYSINGIFRTTVEPGEHEVRLYWSKTRIMWIADILTLSSLALLLIVIINAKLYRGK